MTARTNEEWLADLAATGPQKDDALADLRDVLLGGLRRGLTNWVQTSGPDFQALAEDFVQDALLKILENLDSFEGRSKFTTWAHKITVRVALTELRRKRWKDRSLDQMLSDAGPFSFVVPDRKPTPERVAVQADLMAQVQAIIEHELTEKQRQAMLAVPIGGMPLDVAAREMGMQRNAMYKLLHDARKKLKRELLARGVSADDILRAFE